MKKLNSTCIALAMILAMGSLTACGKSGTSDNKQTQASTTQANTTQTSTAKPVEHAELKIHFHSNNKYTISDKNGEILPVFKLAAEKTNTTLVNTANVVAQKSTEEFQLQAAEKFPSDIYSGNTDSIISYAYDGAFIPLNDLIEQYGPNIKKYLEEHEDIKKSLTAADGNIYTLNYVPDGDVARTYIIRTDWLKKLGLSTPTTFDELEKVLYAFRDNDPNGNGLKDEIPYFNDKWEEMIRLANLWGARVYGYDSNEDRIVLDKNDKLYHAWTAPEFKEALIGINKWYKDGIIDPEIFTRKANTARQTLWTKDNTGGMTHEWLASTTSYNYNKELLSLVPDFKAEAILPVNKNGKGFEEHVRAMIKPEGWAISANCKTPEAAIRFMDWFFSEEGNRAANFGIEGDTYTMVDGKPTFTEKVLSQGTVNTFLQSNYGAQLPIGYAQDYAYEAQWTVKEGTQANALYAANAAEIYTALPTPVFNLGQEESKIYSSYITALNEYQNETVTAFITGKTDINANWDAYIAQCKELGSEELVRIYQEAYDKYKTMK